MQAHDIAPHLAELTRALGDKIGTEVSEDDLKEELQKYLDYGVPPDQAVRTILRAHGEQSAPATDRPAPVTLEGRTPLGKLPGNAQSADILARILTMNTRTVNARGEEKQIIWGLLADETGSLPYTSWRPLEGLEKGDVVEIQGVYTKEFRGETQINFGDRCTITKKDPETLPEQPVAFEDLEVADLSQGRRGFRVSGRFLTVETREVNVKGEPKQLWSGKFADRSGKIEFTCWDDLGLKEGDAVTIEGGYIRAFRGQPQLNFDKDATIKPFDGDLPEAEDLDVVHAIPIADLLKAGDMGDVAVRATLLEVRPGSGLIWRDPETNRVVPSGGEATPDLRIKMVLDDGTGSVSAVVGRETTERILGKDLEACMAQAKEAMRPDIIAEEIAEKVEGRVFAAEGFARTDDYGTMLICRSLVPGNQDAEAEAQEILDGLAEVGA